MEFKKYKNLKDNYIKDNFLLKSIIIIEALLISYLVFIVIEKTDSQKTVFLPPQSTYKEFWVSGDTVSKSYLETIGAFISYNLLNVNRDNADRLISNLLPLVKSDNYYEVKMELTKLHNYVVQNQLARAFYLNEVKQITDNQFVVFGSLVDSMSTKVIRNSKIKLVVDYEIKFGQFYITNLSLQDD